MLAQEIPGDLEGEGRVWGAGAAQKGCDVTQPIPLRELIFAIWKSVVI